MSGVGTLTTGKLTDEGALSNISAAITHGGGTIRDTTSGHLTASVGNVTIIISPTSGDAYSLDLHWTWRTSTYICYRAGIKYYQVFTSGRSSSTGSSVISFSETTRSTEWLGSTSTYDSPDGTGTGGGSGNIGFVIDKGESLIASHTTSPVVIFPADIGSTARYYVLDGAATEFTAYGSSVRGHDVVGAGYAIIGPLYGPHGGNIPSNVRRVCCYPDELISTRACDVAINSSRARFVDGLII